MKKGHQKFLPLNWKFFQKKNVILVGENFFRPPKLGARFPPLQPCIRELDLSLSVAYQSAVRSRYRFVLLINAEKTMRITIIFKGQKPPELYIVFICLEL